MATGDIVLALAALAVALFLLRGLWNATRVDVEVVGLADEMSLTLKKARALQVGITVSPIDRLASSVLELDGEPLDAQQLDEGYRWSPGADVLAPGRHRLELRVPRPVLGASTFRWDFVVDGEPPTLLVPSIVPVASMGAPVRIRGRVEVGASLRNGGRSVEVDSDGRFELSFDRAPAGPIRLTATDEADQVTQVEVFTPVARPEVRGVHVSGVAWSDPVRRRAVLDLVDQGRVNTVQLDLKDESGEVVYDSKIPLARRIGARKNYFVLHDAVDELHRRGVRVVGRIVAFADPVLADAAWRDPKMRSWVLQNADGSRHKAYGGFTNFAAEGVQRYNLDVALEGAEAGMDEILWDYIRRPENPLESMVFPGLDKKPEDAVVDFLARSHRALRAKGVYQGASVFGVAAKEGLNIAQNIPQMARHVDYLAPMLYPSLWANGEYSVNEPATQPGLIISRSLARFKELTKPMGIPLTPWLQDFSLKGVAYRDPEVRAQISAAGELGVDEWLLWNPRTVYHGGALDRRR